MGSPFKEYLLPDLDHNTPSWLRKSIDGLIEAARNADITGTSLVNVDIRSDNICFVDEQVIFIDWSHAYRGSTAHDLAAFLSTLHWKVGRLPL